MLYMMHRRLVQSELIGLSLGILSILIYKIIRWKFVRNLERVKNSQGEDS